jgi:Holliday junction resolvasome RuvABC endonuclease subunit
MKILAIDPATTCGWAHSDGFSGVWDLSVRRDESKGMRLLRLKGKIAEVHAATGVDLIVFEASRNSKNMSAVVLSAKFQGVIEAWATEKDVEYQGFSPAEIKKHATGKGNANKDAMMEAARRKWPHETIADDNHADALWILDLARCRMVV